MPDVILWICGLFEDFVKCQLLPLVALQVFMYKASVALIPGSVISRPVDQTGFLLGYHVLVTIVSDQCVDCNVVFGNWIKLSCLSSG